VKLVFSNSQFAVFDEVLSKREFTMLRSYMQSEDYQFVHKYAWNKAFRLTDGQPLEGQPVFSIPPGDANPDKLHVYPLNSGIDLLIEFILKNCGQFDQWIGVKGKHWDVVSAKPYLFPKDTGLSWHSDHKGRTGSFTYYAHPHWNVQWGGELLIADESVKDLIYPRQERYGADEHKRIGSELDNSFENEKLLSVGVGHYVMPKPNRMVILAGGNLHRVNVASFAGDNVRCSITGFFFNCSK